MVTINTAQQERLSVLKNITICAT